jgi:hypothetical protein
MEKLTASLKEYLEELLYKVFVASVLLAILIFIMDALFKLALQDGLYSLFS